MISARHQEIRHAIEHNLGTSMKDSTWSWLVREGVPAKIDATDMTTSDAASMVRDVWEKAGIQAPNRAERTEMLPLPEEGERRSRNLGKRQWALSLLLAREAEKGEGVTTFRRKVLKGRLVKFENIGAWIERRGKKDGLRTRWLEVPLPDRAEYNAGRISITPPIQIGNDYEVEGSLRARFLKYAAPGSNVQNSIAVTHGKTLDHLRAVSEHLSRRFGWQEGQATTFVLTGRVPLLDICRVVTRIRSPMGATSRVELIVDPGLSPKQVADVYQGARRDLVGPRHRELSEKHIVLAQFAAERQEGETLAQSMKRWNQTYPDWRYKVDTNFGRDILNAQRRLLQPGQAFSPGRKRKNT